MAEMYVSLDEPYGTDEADFLYGPEDAITIDKIPPELEFHPEYPHQPEDPSLLVGIIYLDEADEYNYLYWLAQNDPRWNVCFHQKGVYYHRKLSDLFG